MNDTQPETNKTISFIIPSINRRTLQRTIGSIEVWSGDEILVEFDLPKTGMWGNPQRNKAMARAKGDYLAFIDDDDYYVVGHRSIMDQAIKDNPDKPIIFKQQYPDGRTIWEKPELIPGNVSTAMMLVTNKPEMLYHWEAGRNMADFIFMHEWKFPEIVWREEVIAQVNQDGGAKHHD